MRKFTLLLVSLLLAGAQMLQAQRTITGTVISAEDNQGIPGVSVVVKGTTVGASTDINGRYSLNVPNDAQTLVFSFMGMSTQEIAIAGQTSINVTMQSDAQLLETVVVTGYGNIKKSAFTGSAEVVGAELIERVQSGNFTKSLEGLAPGVQVTGNSGQPGSGMDIRIRGVGSVNASNSPLYIVDGAPFDGYINSINPDDIESISLLKDASTTALYGARGANGVVLITTKRGRGAKATLNFKATYGIITRGLPEYDLLDQREYYESRWMAMRNSYMTREDDPLDITAAGLLATELLFSEVGGYNAFNVPNDAMVDPVTGKMDPNATLLWNDDWQKELFKTGHRQEYQFSGSKGDADNNFFASMSYLNETGIVPQTGFKRLTARLNSNNKLNKWAKLEMALGASTQKYDNVASDGSSSIINPFAFTRNMPKIYPIWQHDPNTGEFLIDGGERIFDFGNDIDGMQPGAIGRKYSPGYNLLASLPLDYSGREVEALNARAALDIQIIDGLVFKIIGTADVFNNYAVSYNNSKYGEYVQDGGLLQRNQEKRFSYTVKEQLLYSKQIRDHNFSALIGHESYAYDYQYLSASKTNFPFFTHELALGADLKSITSYRDEYRLESYLANVNYDYQGKYFLTAAFRRDGSSRFAPGARWGNFWSFGGAWNITREEFMKSANIPWLDLLKLKVSYGAQGNDGTSSWYPWQGSFNMTYKNNGYPGAIHATLDNLDLRWESQKMFNTGIDFYLFKNLSGTFEYYIRNNKDMLFSKPLPASTGIRSIQKNIGEMRSSGIELQLNYTLYTSKDFTWSVGANMTHWRDKIIKLDPSDSLGINSGTKKIKEGHSLYEFYLKEYAGVNDQGQALYYKGENKEETTTDWTSASYYYTGKYSIPKIYGGFNTTFEYKGFDLSIIFSYALGGWVYDDIYATLMHGGTASTGQWHKDILLSWSHENPNSDIPELNKGRADNNTAASTRFLTSGSYLNLKNVTFGYTLPRDLTRKISIQNCRVFVTLDNYWLKSARKGMDPQQSLAGSTSNNYYPTKTLTFGLSAQF